MSPQVHTAGSAPRGTRLGSPAPIHCPSALGAASPDLVCVSPDTKAAALVSPQCGSCNFASAPHPYPYPPHSPFPRCGQVTWSQRVTPRTIVSFIAFLTASTSPLKCSTSFFIESVFYLKTLQLLFIQFGENCDRNYTEYFEPQSGMST